MAGVLRIGGGCLHRTFAGDEAEDSRRKAYFAFHRVLGVKDHNNDIPCYSVTETRMDLT